MASTESTPEIKPKKPSETATFLAEIVGEDGLKGKRMAAGAILDVMDGLAGRVAARHVGGPVATVSFDRVDLTHPILHGDLVRLEGTLIHCGSSSLIVRVTCLRHDTTTREYIKTHVAYITMVAIDVKTLRPAKIVPPLELTDEEATKYGQVIKIRDDLKAKWQRMQAEVDNADSLDVAKVEDPVNQDGKHNYLSPASTEIELRRGFLPRHLNHNQTVFGGDILKWMDQAAMYCAQAFTGNPHMIVVSMNRVHFKQPIFAIDMLMAKARVCYVRNYTVEVEINVQIERGKTGEVVPSHTGYFTVLNFNEVGFKRKVVTGLALSNDDQETLRSYEKAKRRRGFWFEMERSIPLDETMPLHNPLHSADAVTAHD